MNFELFKTSLSIMAQGMVGVFIVIIIIFITVILLTRLFPEDEQN